jgi:hypothetical protein
MPGGIFCIENWSGDLRSPATVRSLLDFMETSGAARGHTSTRFYSARTAPLPCAVLRARNLSGGLSRAHGSRGKVYVGSREVTLKNLAVWSRLDDEAIVQDRTLDDPEPTVDRTERFCTSAHARRSAFPSLDL